MWGEPAGINLSSQGHANNSGTGVPALHRPARGMGEGCTAHPSGQRHKLPRPLPAPGDTQRAAEANPMPLCFPSGKRDLLPHGQLLARAGERRQAHVEATSPEHPRLPAHDALVADAGSPEQKHSTCATQRDCSAQGSGCFC